MANKLRRARLKKGKEGETLRFFFFVVVVVYTRASRQPLPRPTASPPSFAQPSVSPGNVVPHGVRREKLRLIK